MDTPRSGQLVTVHHRTMRLEYVLPAPLWLQTPLGVYTVRGRTRLWLVQAWDEEREGWHVYKSSGRRVTEAQISLPGIDGHPQDVLDAGSVVVRPWKEIGLSWLDPNGNRLADALVFTQALPVEIGTSSYAGDEPRFDMTLIALPVDPSDWFDQITQYAVGLKIDPVNRRFS